MRMRMRTVVKTRMRMRTRTVVQFVIFVLVENNFVESWFSELSLEHEVAGYCGDLVQCCSINAVDSFASSDSYL